MYKYILILMFIFFIIFYKTEVKHKIKIIKNFETSDEIQRGLMFIKEPIGENNGALFNMKENRVHTFWMKNTYIPLDIIFMNEDWKIVCLINGAKPLDETMVGCNVNSIYVIETDNGYIDKNGVSIGDYIECIY